MKVHSKPSLVRRAWTAIVVFALTIASAIGLASPASAFSYLCLSANYGFSCVSFSGYSGQSTWGYPVDSRGHNCTNYAAYRLAQNGAANPGNLGHASDWDSNARAKGFAVNGTPTIGSIAQWEPYVGAGTGATGHVGYVEAVGDGYIEVTDDNWGGTTSRKKYFSGQSDWPSNFLHIKDAVPMGGVSSISGDNKADLVWYEAWNNGGQAKVITTNSSGTGAASGNAWFSGYAKPDWAGVGDFNGDGRTDLAWYESWNNGVLKVLFSNGTTYASSIVWFSGFGKPKWAGVGDFTGDGKDDIAWYEDWNNGGTLKVIPTNAAGNGANASITWFSGFSAPDWADVGDLTGDGKDDIAWYEGWNNGSLKVIVTNSSGTGAASGNTWFSGYGAPTWAAIGNFSGDGKEDIAWYEDWNSGGKVTILPSNGSGTNPGISWFSGYAKPDRAFAADFTGDGRDDIAWFEGWNNGTLKVIPTKTDGTGTGPSITWFSGYAAPTWAAAG